MRRLPGINKVQASYRKGNVVVQYDPAQVSPKQMGDAIAAATYYTVGEPVPGGEFGSEAAAQGSTAVIRVEGMTDERTASRFVQAVGAVGPGVVDVSTDISQSTLTLVYDAEQLSPEKLVDAINRNTPYRASLVSKTEAEPGGGTDYVPYILIGIFALFAAALAWTGFSWGRRRLARAHAQSRAARRRGRRGR